ncbi:MAG: hypothetical protein ACKO34_06380 [Vampirovibrionales bacterium]
MPSIRDDLVRIALMWQANFGIAPAITSALSEYDAALLLGCTESEFSECMKHQTAVTKGFDFIYKGKRYQVKANRPSGNKGSKVTLVAKAKNYEWDILIWILYNKEYQIEEAWYFDVDTYKELFDVKKRLSPKEMRLGSRLF